MHKDNPAGGSAWRRASHCGTGPYCVEVTVTTDTSRWPHKADAEKLYLMRDSKKPDGPVLAFTPEEWEAKTTSEFANVAGNTMEQQYNYISGLFAAEQTAAKQF